MNATVGSQETPQSSSKDSKTQMTNFLAETINAIVEAHQYTQTVLSVRSRDGEYATSWEEFAKLADFNYDSGFGSAQIPSDLIVEFVDDTYLYREEYDGAENWAYASRLPLVQPNVKPLTKLVGRYWPTVDGLHNPNEWDEDDR